MPGRGIGTAYRRPAGRGDGAAGLRRTTPVVQGGKSVRSAGWAITFIARPSAGALPRRSACEHPREAAPRPVPQAGHLDPKWVRAARTSDREWSIVGSTGEPTLKFSAGRSIDPCVPDVRILFASGARNSVTNRTVAHPVRSYFTSIYAVFRRRWSRGFRLAY